jgi:hypothetical protein
MRKEKLISPRLLNTILKTLGAKKSKAAATFLVLYNLFKKRLEGRPAQNTKAGNNKALNSDHTKIDFLNAYCAIRYCTFKLQTVASAWKKAGLLLFNLEVVYIKLL